MAVSSGDSVALWVIVAILTFGYGFYFLTRLREWWYKRRSRSEHFWDDMIRLRLEYFLANDQNESRLGARDKPRRFLVPLLLDEFRTWGKGRIALVNTMDDVNESAMEEEINGALMNALVNLGSVSASARVRPDVRPLVAALCALQEYASDQKPVEQHVLENDD